MSYRTVTTDDGVRLAVRESGPHDAPIIVCVHGFPDDGTVWDGVAAALSTSYRVVVYDVRGAGKSDRPHERYAYLLDRLAADLVTVVDEVSPNRPVHLLAHDWGSLQVWHALTRNRLTRVASFTSISGPSLHQAGRWLRAQFRTRKTWARGLWQAASSSYITFFQLPLLPEALSRSGLFNLILRADRSRRGQPAHHDDFRYGLELYRANMMRGRRTHKSGPRTKRTVGVPVMVLAPTRDRYVGVDLQTDVADWVSDLRIHRIHAGHWVPISHPEVVAGHVAEFIAAKSQPLG